MELLTQAVENGSKILEDSVEGSGGKYEATTRAASLKETILSLNISKTCVFDFDFPSIALPAPPGAGQSHPAPEALGGFEFEYNVVSFTFLPP